MDLIRTDQFDQPGDEDRVYLPADMDCALNRQLMEYWQDCGKNSALPHVGDFDIIEVHEFAPWIALIDVLNEGEDFYYRLAGPKYARIIGDDLSGKLLRDCSDKVAIERLTGIFVQALALSGPICVSGKVGHTNGRAGFHSEACILPLTNDAGVIIRLVHMIRIKKDNGEWSR